LLPLLDDVRHRLRRGASHLPAPRSRQNVNLFLREPLVRGQQIHRLHLLLRKNSLEILSHDSKQGDDIVDVIEGDYNETFLSDGPIRLAPHRRAKGWRDR